MGSENTAVESIFGRYWRAYGGWSALFCSGYLYAALALLLLTANLWTKPDWWDAPLGILPNLLGFTLGGFAIFISFGDKRFLNVLIEADEEEPADAPSPFMELSATFVHFILVQVAALTWALVAKSWWFHIPWLDGVAELRQLLTFIGWGIGYGLFLYAVVSVVALAMHVFRLAWLYEQTLRVLADSEHR